MAKTSERNALNIFINQLFLRNDNLVRLLYEQKSASKNDKLYSNILSESTAIWTIPNNIWIVQLDGLDTD